MLSEHAICLFVSPATMSSNSDGPSGTWAYNSEATSTTFICFSAIYRRPERPFEKVALSSPDQVKRSRKLQEVSQPTLEVADIFRAQGKPLIDNNRSWLRWPLKLLQ